MSEIDRAAHGLSSEETARRLLHDGPNQIARVGVSNWQLLFRQAQGLIFWLLVLATLVSVALGQTVEATAMVAILVLNVTIGFAQELHTEGALRKLRVATEPQARVRREGHAVRVPVSRIVTGDVLLLETGDVVAADGVICTCCDLLVDEAELTGEAMPVPKTARHSDDPSDDSRVLMGTAIVGGTATAIVVATGTRTELGRIAHLADFEEPPSPLRRQLDQLGQQLVFGCVGIVLLVAAAALGWGADLGHVVLSSLSLTVASLPESLGAVVTIALTAAARKLSMEKVLVRRLDAVEALGDTTLVCVGKSGTLTTSEHVGANHVAEHLRPEAKEFVDLAHRAGIRVVMMTGGHELEADAIAKQLGLEARGSNERKPLVYANATPAKKLEYVQSWQAEGEVVTVIGDRVNDAPAVREADVGVAMGDATSDVVRDAADVLLLDDGLTHLANALWRGRGVHQSVRNSLLYVLTGNLAELTIMLVASTIGWSEPLVPLQLLWVNLITDSLPALALALEPADRRALEQRPRRSDEPMLGRREWTTIVVMGFFQAGVALSAYRIASSGGDLARARALCLSVLVFGELFWALAPGGRVARHVRHPNATLRWVVFGSVSVEAALAMLPLRNAVGRVLHLGPRDVALALLLGLVPLGLMRAYGAFANRFGPSNARIAPPEHSSGGSRTPLTVSRR